MAGDAGQARRRIIAPRSRSRADLIAIRPAPVKRPTDRIQRRLGSMGGLD
jgi:hypothetical protein